MNTKSFSLGIVCLILLIPFLANAQQKPEPSKEQRAPVVSSLANVSDPPKLEKSAQTKEKSEESYGYGWAPFGAIAYTPETSALIGAAATVFYAHPPEEKRRDSQTTLAFAYSLKKQYSLLVTSDLFLMHDRLHLGTLLSFSKFPNDFFGVGNNTLEQDKEHYTPIFYELSFSPKWRVVPNWYVGPSFRVNQVTMKEVESGQSLDQHVWAGSRGGRTMQIGIRTFWDTRDDTLYPLRGTFAELLWHQADKQWGSDFNFGYLRADIRQYVPMPWKRHLIALQLVAEHRTQAPPFYELGQLGGDSLLRGYFQGRYRDRQLFALQAEYRAPLVWRFGATVFASVGEVGNQWQKFSLQGLRPAVGSGLRFAPSAKAPVNLRLDFAYGDDMRFYLHVGEAFLDVRSV
jgi:outer membrane protein assembly factor BamA